MLQDCGTQQGRSILVLIIEEIGAKTLREIYKVDPLSGFLKNRLRVRGLGFGVLGFRAYGPGYRVELSKSRKSLIL